ncbi:MAG TPA: hypothetical protein VFP84_27890 [Kofleriaceae bacterium]|nr:hypothetical protein [Kofleriaceae bacterium]
MFVFELPADPVVCHMTIGRKRLKDSHDAAPCSSVEVAMNQTCRMGGRERRARLLVGLEDIALATAFDPLPQRLAPDELHDEVHVVVLNAHSVNRYDIRMRQPCQGLGLGQRGFAFLN